MISDERWEQLEFEFIQQYIKTTSEDSGVLKAAVALTAVFSFYAGLCYFMVRGMM